MAGMMKVMVFISGIDIKVQLPQLPVVQMLITQPTPVLDGTCLWTLAKDQVAMYYL